MSDLDLGRLADGDAGDRGVLVDQKLGCGFGWRWVILFSGWFSFALFSATLYTSGKFLSGKIATNVRRLQVFSLSFISRNLGKHALQQPG